MILIFSFLGGALLIRNKKRTISIMFCLEVLFFTLIFLMGGRLPISYFFILICVIVLRATFRLALFVGALRKYSSEAQQIFLRWG